VSSDSVTLTTKRVYKARHLHFFMQVVCKTVCTRCGGNIGAVFDASGTLWSYASDVSCHHWLRLHISLIFSISCHSVSSRRISQVTASRSYHRLQGGMRW